MKCLLRVEKVQFNASRPQLLGRKPLSFGGAKECDLLYCLGFPYGLDSLLLLQVLEAPEMKTEIINVAQT